MNNDKKCSYEVGSKYNTTPPTTAYEMRYCFVVYSSHNCVNITLLSLIIQLDNAAASGLRRWDNNAKTLLASHIKRDEIDI